MGLELLNPDVQLIYLDVNPKKVDIWMFFCV